ncbi:probable peroxygenase 5 isoform X1 [Ipomoea triloba]|uniref:probable peroxygenase 5 isoform X1 n=1 Tax=Ipomoea triloba TaxID=35885 RepID=UPI00125CE749|nr:probable peroxygenase 5 isoform X1 [Ipomoea triloba]
MAAQDSTSSSNNAIVYHDGMGRPSELSPLQKHVSFFDINKDGIVYPWETYQGFRKIGCGVPLSVFASLFINFGLSQKTRPGKWPSPLLPIEVGNIKLSKHTSDSGVYDSEGRFVESKFEEIFKKHAKSNPNGLTSVELDEMLQANRKPNDYGGWIGALSEWKILYLIGKDKNGILPKETIRGVYDGSLFESMAKKHASKKCGNNFLL